MRESEIGLYCAVNFLYSFPGFSSRIHYIIISKAPVCTSGVIFPIIVQNKKTKIITSGKVRIKYRLFSLRFTRNNIQALYLTVPISTLTVNLVIFNTFICYALPIFHTIFALAYQRLFYFNLVAFCLQLILHNVVTIYHHSYAKLFIR